VPQSKTLSGVGRLHRGHRSLGCVGYSLQSTNGPPAEIQFDPMPDATPGDVFHLTLEDGRILECRVLTNLASQFSVIDGPRPERRQYRRPPASARAYL